MRSLKEIFFLGMILCIFIAGNWQIVIDASPSSYTIIVQNTSTFTFDMDSNSINGASCVGGFAVAGTSPTNPSWMTLSGYTLTFSPPTLDDIGVYEIQFEVTESGVGPWLFVPHNRRLILLVNKLAPIVGYSIPDYNNMRAAIPYDLTFPSSPWVDTHGDTLSYDLLDQNDIALSNSFNYDSTTTGRIYGTVPNSQAGTYLLRLTCKDSMDQRINQDFTMFFASNNNPTRVITDMTPYAFTISEGVNSTYTLPSGIYLDSDGDSIIYELWFFENFAQLSTAGWANFYSGPEGISYIELIEPTSTTHNGFNIMLSDGISSTIGPFLINFTFNHSPTASITSLNITIYPNTTFTTTVDLNTYFSDPESQILAYSSHTLPFEVTTSSVSSSQLKIEADFTSAFPSSDVTFYFQATDGTSRPTDLQVRILSWIDLG
jgi:hypothetical protein